jgi:cytoskeletal protein CcmA (bactofilin family)
MHRSSFEEALEMAWLGQKSDPEPARTAPTPAPASAPAAQAAAPSLPKETRERTEVRNVANIGKSIYVKGELSGNEDLVIDGKVEGKIVLAGHSVTIGQSGTVTAEIQAKAVVVHGQVKGNVTAEDRVEVAATGTMQGDVRAPRVVLADGAKFRGSIDMDGSALRDVRAASSKPAAAVAQPAAHMSMSPSES